MSRREALDATVGSIGERTTVLGRFCANRTIVLQGFHALASGFLEFGKVARAKQAFRFVEIKPVKQPSESGDVICRGNGGLKANGCGTR